MSNALQSALDGLAKGLAVAAPFIPGVGGTIAKIATITFESAAAIARSGKDPVVEIARIHAADPLVAAVKDEWRDALDAKFGKE